MGDTALNVRLGAKTGEFNKKMLSASAKMKKFGKSVSNVGRSMSTMFTMPILAAAGASIKLSLDFQKSMTKIQTLVGKTGAEIETMKTGILEMSTKTAKAPVELAEGLYFLESAGLRGANAMETLEQVAKGSASGLGDMEALSVVAAAAQNAYGEETLSASDALDKFGVMVRTGMFDAQELSNVLGKQLGLASNLGISFDEVGAVISTYTSTTGDATSATNGLSAIMMTFAKLETEPTTKQASALSAIGMTAEGVKEMMGEKGLVGTMKHLQTEFDANGVAMGAFFSSSQALKGALGVLGSQTEVLESNLDAMSKSSKDAGFVNDAFAVTAETSAFKMEQAMNGLKVAGTSLGDSLAPVVQVLSEKIQSLTDWWNGLDKETKDNYASWAIWIATVGPALMIIGGIVSKVGMLVGVMKKFQVIQKVATAAQWLWNAAMTANPIGVIIMAIAAVIAAIVYFSTSTSTTAIKVRNAFSAMANVVIGALNFLINGINRFSKHLGFTIPTISKFKKEALPAMEETADATDGAADAVNDLGTNLNNLPATKNIKVNTEVTETKVAKITVGDVEDPIAKSKRLFDIEKKSLANIAKLKKQFLVLNAKDDQAAARIMLQQQKQAALDNVKAAGLGAEERENIEKNFGKKMTTLLGKQKEENKKVADATLTDWEKAYAGMEEGWGKVSDVAGQVFSAVGGMMDAQADKEKTILDNKHALENEDFAIWQEAQDIKAEEIKVRLEEGLITEKEAKKQLDLLELNSVNAQKTLQTEQDAETAKIEKKAAKREKKMAIMSALMNGATAVVKALGSAPPPLNFVLAGIVGALAGIQIAAISSTPIPMAEGGVVFGPTNALVGEYAGAKSNPEVVAPLNKLKSMLGDTQGTQRIEIFGRLDGNDIFLSNDNAQAQRLRFT